jgi:hypothetical protein
MALEDEVKKALIDAGNELKKDLWHPEDLELLAARARDLVGLDRKASEESDPAKKAQYKMAAGMVLDHVKLLALLRMQVARKDIETALGNFFMKTVLPALGALLKAVVF